MTVSGWVQEENLLAEAKEAGVEGLHLKSACSFRPVLPLLNVIFDALSM